MHTTTKQGSTQGNTGTISTDTVGRAHHVVDIENLLGLTHGTSVDPAAGRLYRAIARVGATDLVTVAADVNRWADAKFAFPGARVLPGYGTDGADRALHAAIDVDHIALRFDTLVIASGDHWFIDLAYRARAKGLKVVVVSRAAALSKYLAPYADEVLVMPTIVDGRALPETLTHAA